MADDQRVLRGPDSPQLLQGRARGPRSLFLKRSENGFGFTFRHFIIYPPESTTVLAADKRMGLRGAGSDAPMDTMFVKSVRPGSPAALAGLQTGDRVISVNGETTAGKSYAHVVHLIQQSPPYLHLLVVPREEDIIQQYFGETAHNPETNQRPRLRSPDTIHVRDYSSPTRRASECSTRLVMSAASNGSDYSGSNGSYSLPGNTPGCRLSLDASMVIPRNEALSITTHHSTDDSLILSRIRKSCEQKEEFLRRPPAALWIGVRGDGGAIPREFYSRPQKLQVPIWPPAIPASQANRPVLDAVINSTPKDRGGFVYGGPVSNPPMGSGIVRFSARLGRIQETNGNGTLRTSSASPPPSHKMVPERARQFEQGQCQVDRTGLYRSELARLGTKKNVPNVAVRRREFESRASDWRTHRESRSLDSSVEGITISSGSRADPVGSAKIHCDPHVVSESSLISERRRPRQRSNSIEAIRPGSEDTWPLRNKAVRQDSYLAAVNKPVVTPICKAEKGSHPCLPEIRLDPPVEKPQRPTTLDLVNRASPSDPVIESPLATPEDNSSQSSPGPDTVVRRNKTGSDEVSEDERATRRASYLRATWGDRMHVDSDLELSDTEQINSSHRRKMPDYPTFPDSLIEGELNVKRISDVGQKSNSKKWHKIWASVRDSTLFIYADQKEYDSEFPVSIDTINLRSCLVEEAKDYTKKRNVIRLTAADKSEYLLQAPTLTSMEDWIEQLKSCDEKSDSNQESSSGPRTNMSPVTGHKTMNKLASLRNRSPTGHHSKARKTNQQPQSGEGQPKTKTWKVRVAKQWKKIQPGTGSPVSPTAPTSVTYPEGATINVPLELCPMGPDNKVPLLVTKCTEAVEERGLDTIGIYRVPGNSSAVSHLKEAIQKDFKTALRNKSYWLDPNVISSLLKAFFRSLPIPLFTTKLYQNFIQANKIEEPQLRISTIRQLVHDLPEHHYETLKHLMFHLKLVVEHSSVNKMEARNLAIVFGPTLIRAADDNMVTMVTDMSHQCMIVETLILHGSWVFSDWDLDKLILTPIEKQNAIDSNCTTNKSLLLENVNKVYGMKDSPSRDISPKDLVTSIINAANRKMLRGTKTRKPAALTFDKSQEENSPPKSAPPSVMKNEHPNVAESLEKEDKSSISECDKTEYKEVPQFSSLPSHMSKPPEHGEEQIMTYPRLCEATRERVKKFEKETLSMLKRGENIPSYVLTEPLPNFVDIDQDKSTNNMFLDKKRMRTTSDICLPCSNHEGDKSESSRPMTAPQLSEHEERKVTEECGGSDGSPSVVGFRPKSNPETQEEEKENQKLLRVKRCINKRKNGKQERAIKRRHTVGGTADFDKDRWLMGKKVEERETSEGRRASSPDLTRILQELAN